MSSWPKITVVTPSYNQGKFLQETISSVLNQSYSNTEYIIIDGGSTDNSIEIIRSFESSLAYWQSQPDDGQSDAIRQGFNRATGDVLCWLNSDDYFEPNTLEKVAEIFRKNKKTALVYGDYYVLFPEGRVLKRKVSFDFPIALNAYMMIPQSAAFWRRDVYEATGGLDATLKYAMDYDLFLKIGQAFEKHFVHLREPLSTFRIHEDSKTTNFKELMSIEVQKVKMRYTNDSAPVRNIKTKWHLLRVLLRYFLERRYIPLKKDKRTN